MMIGGDVYLQLVLGSVSSIFEGPYGTGKTCVAVATALALSHRLGWPVYSNLNIRGCLWSERDVRPRTKCIILYDEAWQSLAQGVSIKTIIEYLAYLRHDDLLFLMTSVIDIAKHAYFFQVRRRFNYGIFGLPLWRFEFNPRGKSVKKFGGSFLVWNPGHYFGLYDHHARPPRISGLFDV